MALFQTCHLHIGFEKTGSTSIQAFLTDNVDRLQRLGFFVPRSLARSDGFCNHIRLPAHAMREDRLEDDVRTHYGLTSPHQLADFRDATRELLEREIRARGGAAALLLSNEHLSSRLDQASELIRLRDLLSPFCDSFRIIAYLRNQVDVLESIYSEAIKGGFCDIDLIPNFTTDVPAPWIAREYFEYDRTLERWVEVFGQDCIEVRLFDPETMQSGDVVRDFLSCLCIDGSRFGDLPRINERLDSRVQAFLLQINRTLRLLPSGDAGRIREVVIDILSGLPRGRARQLSEREALDFMALFEAQNEAVRRRWFPSSPSLFRSVKSRQRSPQIDAEASTEDIVELTSTLLQKLILKS